MLIKKQAEKFCIPLCRSFIMLLLFKFLYFKELCRDSQEVEEENRRTLLRRTTIGNGILQFNLQIFWVS